MVTRTISIRDNTPYEEVIAIKREWQYPLYTHPEFYFDIAVFELGKEINLKLKFTNKSNMKLSFLYYSERRIIYDYEKIGDSPTCLGETNGIAGLEALSQGKEIIV